MLLAVGLLYFLVSSHLASYSNLHEVMNEEELRHYFGTSDTSDLQDTYDVALLRKVKDDNILTRYLKADADSVEDYVFEAFGKEVSLKMRKNNLLGKNICFSLLLVTMLWFSVTKGQHRSY